MSTDDNSEDGHHQSVGEDEEQREQKLERNEKLVEAAEEGNVLSPNCWLKGPRRNMKINMETQLPM